MSIYKKKSQRLKHSYIWNEDESKYPDFKDYKESDREELLTLIEEYEDSNQLQFKPGNILKGKIVYITKKHVAVDVSLKSEGFIPIEEFVDKEELKVGNIIDVFLKESIKESGQISLSKEKANKQKKWEYILKNCKEGSILSCKVLYKVKGGLIVDLNGIDAFLPGSQISNRRVTSVDEYIGNVFDVKLVKINLERKNIVVSRREVIENDRISKKAKMLDKLSPGDMCRGRIKNVTDFGVFLEIDEVDGLLHITDMTWKRIKHPSEIIKDQTELDVVVIGIDKEKGRVALGMKQKEKNPWEELKKKYPPGTIVKGKVKKILAYGIFIEIEPLVEGLIHISEISWLKTIEDPHEIAQKDDILTAVVLSINTEEGKISLGMKQLEENPWDGIEEKYPVGTKVNVYITKIVNYGAFVELEPGVGGLIHISNMSWSKYISHPTDIKKIQNKARIDAEILSVDSESKKIILSIKDKNNNPWDNIEELLPIGKIVSAKITRILDFGVFVILEQGIDGLIHNTQIDKNELNHLKQGQEIEAKVLKIDKEQQRIALSTETNYSNNVEGG